MPKDRGFQGFVRMRNDILRVDFEKPMSMSSIVDLGKRKAYGLVHAAKMIVETPFAEASQQVPTCKTSEIDACLKRLGYREVAKETIAAQPCLVLEAVLEDQGKKTRVRLWRPTALKEVPALRIRAYTPDGEVQTEFKDVKVQAQKASYFELPRDYRNVGNMKIPGLEGVGG